MNTPGKWLVGTAATIVTLGGAATVITNWYDSMPVPESTKEWHEQAPISEPLAEALEEFSERMDKQDAVIAIPTIMPLARRACLEPNEPRWRVQLSQRLAQYQKGEGYEFIVPSCEELLRADGSQ